MECFKKAAYLIPETLEISSSEISSEDSSESDITEKKEQDKKSENSSKSKAKEITEKKKVELSISQSTSFSLNQSYENINQLSEGNYSSDENLQKSVVKLIQVYLSEKNKEINEKDKEK